MVNLPDQRLDRLFGVLSDPTRRAILARLASERGVSVTELAAPFEIKLPAVMKHLDVLDDAGLIRRSKVGRTVTVSMVGGSLKPATDWLQHHQELWASNLDRLVQYVEAKERELKDKGQ